MFYPLEPPLPAQGKKQAAALVVLNPSQSRRLVAKGVVACPIVQNAYRNGLIIIARGITNAYVTEEFFNITIGNKANQTVGFVGRGMTNVSATPPPSARHVIEKSRVIEGDEDKIEKAMELVKSLGNEPPVAIPDQCRIVDPARYDYDVQAQLEVLGGL